jgi:quercetin dioxygenase-like cupin family protein
MTDRSTLLQTFLEHADQAFTAHTHAPEARRVVRSVFAALTEPGTPGEEGETMPEIAREHLPHLLDPEHFSDYLLQELAVSFSDLAPHLVWALRKGDAPNASDGFDTGHANAMIVGPGGLERRSDVWLGVSLLAAGIRYPDHSHPPEETYLTLTAGAFRQQGQDWTEVSPGGTFYNPPGVTHAMRAGDAPMLTFWALNGGA